MFDDPVFQTELLDVLKMIRYELARANTIASLVARLTTQDVDGRFVDDRIPL